MRSFAALALLLASCALPPGRSILAATGTVSGKILLDGKPAAGISVSVSGPGYWHKATTDDAGVWKVEGLKPGSYTFFYENPKDDGTVSYWRGPDRKLDGGGTLAFDAIDVGHYGVPKENADGSRLNMPATFTWSPYPDAKDYGFEVLSGTDRDAHLLFRPDHRVGADVTRIVYEGNVNVRGEPEVKMKDYLGDPGEFLVPGKKYAWSVVWKAADGGQGQGPLGTFELVDLAKSVFPKPADPPQ